MIGLSLAVFGILHALALPFVTGPATKRLARELSFAWRPTRWATSCWRSRREAGWLPHYDSSRLAASGCRVKGPCFRQVGDDHQGQLQGSLAALAANFDHWTADRHGDLCRLGASTTGWHGLWRRPIPCLPPALRRGAWSRATST